MKTIVIYNSQTGFTKKYAEWISEAVSCECVSFKQAAKINLADYDAIVFGSWCMAGTVTKLNWFKKQMPDLISDENPEVAVAMNRVLTEEERKSVKLFYCPGGFNYEKMKAPSRFAMKMFVKGISQKKDATEAEKNMAEMISHSYDISDKKYIEPIVSELKK